jgi:hypothetical protein
MEVLRHGLASFMALFSASVKLLAKAHFAVCPRRESKRGF